MGVIFRCLATFCHSRLANRPASSMMGVCLLCLVFIMGAPSAFSKTWTGSRPQVLAQVATKMDIAQTQDHAMCRKHFAAQTCLKDVCAMQGLRATALRAVRRVPLARIRQGAATRRARTVAPGNTPPRVVRRPRARAPRARQTRTRRRGAMTSRTVSATQALRATAPGDVLKPTPRVIQCTHAPCARAHMHLLLAYLLARAHTHTRSCGHVYHLQA